MVTVEPAPTPCRSSSTTTGRGSVAFRAARASASPRPGGTPRVRRRPVAGPALRPGRGSGRPLLPLRPSDPTDITPAPRSADPSRLAGRPRWPDRPGPRHRTRRGASVRIVLADDLPAVRRASRCCVGRPRPRRGGHPFTGPCAPRPSPSTEADLVIMDLAFQDSNGIDAIKQVREAIPGLHRRRPLRIARCPEQGRGRHGGGRRRVPPQGSAGRGDLRRSGPDRRRP